ncbi:Coiled-coil domain-containing protein [Portunus trituberculatus]|uniref:Coiled-coil domain-containing protein n=1 Tax=Portunus trituberculatus TaxID=210409 RepID=A0A5B7EUX2_PORTR|nr:Coiled-coil domain-containing protein [Portunus trituberculatus]
MGELLQGGQFQGTPISPELQCQDLRLSPEVYNQLRVLQKKAKELRTDVRNLRKTSQANALTMKELLRDTFTKITSVLQSNEESLLQGTSDAERARIQREEASYRQDMNKLDKDLWYVGTSGYVSVFSVCCSDLELKVEELRNNVINRRLRVNMSDVENMALILSRSSKTVADLKAKFPILQDGLKDLISAEMERAICNEKLASVQEQRVPPLGPGGVPVGVANGDPRATSPTPTEDLRASSSKLNPPVAQLRAGRLSRDAGLPPASEWCQRPPHPMAGISTGTHPKVSFVILILTPQACHFTGSPSHHLADNPAKAFELHCQPAMGVGRPPGPAVSWPVCKVQVLPLICATYSCVNSDFNVSILPRGPPVPGPGRLVRRGTWGPRVPLCPLKESGRGLQTPKGIRQCLEYRVTRPAPPLCSPLL